MRKLVVLVGLVAGLWVSAAGAQTQCVGAASAGGTPDAITIPLLPCSTTTNLLLLTLSGANTTTSPTLQMTGFPALPITSTEGGSLGIGNLPGANATVLLYNTGTAWKLVSTSVMSGGALPVTEVELLGSVSGSITLKAPPVAGTNTVVFPAGSTDFSATGGTSQVLRQSSLGGAITVSQLAASDLSNGTTGSGAVVLQTAPTFVSNGGSPDLWATWRKTAVQDWAFSYSNTANLFSVPAMKIGNNGSPELNLYLADVAGGQRVWIWDGSTMPNIPTTGVPPTFAVKGDLLGGDYIGIDSNPAGYFIRANLSIPITSTTSIYSARNQIADTDGGASIVLTPVSNSGGAVDDGTLRLLAYGRGSGSAANSIRLAIRTGVNTAGDIWQVNGANGHFQAVTNNTYDIGAGGGGSPRSIYVGTSFGGPNGSASAPVYSFFNDTTTGLYLGGTGALALSTGGSLRITQTTSQTYIGLGATFAQQAIGDTVQVNTSSTGTGGIAIQQFSNNTSGPLLVLYKTRSTSVGTNSIVSSGDVLGAISFRGDDGTTSSRSAAQIRVLVDATPGASDMPGRIEFQTTRDGAASPTTAMTLDSNQMVSISNGYTQYLTVLGSAASGVTVSTGAGNLIMQSTGGTTTLNDAAIVLTNITTDATHTDRTICQDTTSKQIYFGSGALGVCLGTSSARFKRDINGVDYGLREVMELEPVRYFYRQGYGNDGERELYGFTAEQMAKVMPKLVSLDAGGEPNSTDLVGLVPVLVQALKEQQIEIEKMKGARR